MLSRPCHEHTPASHALKPGEYYKNLSTPNLAKWGQFQTTKFGDSLHIAI